MKDEVTVNVTMRFSRTYKREWCENYDIDTNDPQWASKMVTEDIRALNEGEMSADEFFSDVWGDISGDISVDELLETTVTVEVDNE